MRHSSELAQEFEACNSAIGRICGAYRVECDKWWEFRGGIATRKIGSLEVADVRFSSGKVIKDGRRDEFYQGDRYFLVLQAAGTALMRQRGMEAQLRPGDCTLIDSRFPSVFEVGSDFRQYSFHIPADLLRDSFGSHTVALAHRISGSRGAGAILSNMLQAILRHGDTLEDLDPAHMMLDLLCKAVGVEASRWQVPRPERGALDLGDISDYIDTQLNRSEFGPHELAAHFGVSLRRLYRTSAHTGYTPAALIWRRRLDRARTMLHDPSNRVPITEIALSCGFKDVAHFSRSYRKTFGAAPSAARRGLGATVVRPSPLLEVAC
jgi:AraC-like DNA-binding protein